MKIPISIVRDHRGEPVVGYYRTEEGIVARFEAEADSLVARMLTEGSLPHFSIEGQDPLVVRPHTSSVEQVTIARINEAMRRWEDTKPIVVTRDQTLADKVATAFGEQVKVVVNEYVAPGKALVFPRGLDYAWQDREHTVLIRTDPPVRQEYVGHWHD